MSTDHIKILYLYYFILLLYIYINTVSYSSSTVAFCVILIKVLDFKLFIYFYTIFYLSSYHSRPPCAIFTTSGWPLLTHHGRPLSPTGFSSWVKNDNRHPEGCEVSLRKTGGAPICCLLPSRASRTYGVAHVARGSTIEEGKKR